jgi:hypothetical protein
MFGLGVYAYVRRTKAKDNIGLYALVGFAALLLGTYALAAFGPPPPSIKAVAIGDVCISIVLVAWAWWIDAHREVSESEPRARKAKKEKFISAGG